MDVCELLIVALFIVLAVVPLAIIMAVVKLLAKKRIQRRSRARTARPFNTYTLCPLRRFMVGYLEIYARLTGRTLGIFYWTAYMAYYIWECVVLEDFYVRCLLDQDVNVIEQVQVVQTIHCCLLSITVAVALTSEKIVILCGILLDEKNFLKQPICPSCQKMTCQRESLNRVVHAGTAWLKTM